MIMTLKGYVARDKDESLWFHFRKPRRMNGIMKTWWGSNDKTFRVYDFDFPQFKDLTWEGEPCEVELTIKRL